MTSQIIISISFFITIIIGVITFFVSPHPLFAGVVSYLLLPCLAWYLFYKKNISASRNIKTRLTVISITISIMYSAVLVATLFSEKGYVYGMLFAMFSFIVAITVIFTLQQNNS